MFKKSIIFVLMVILLLNLAGCIPVTLDEYYEISQDVSNIEAIAVYEKSDDENAEYNELKTTPLAVVSKEDFSVFVNDLEAVYCEDVILITIAATDPSFSFGKYTIQIDYMDGSQEFISDAGYQYTAFTDDSVDSNHYSFDDDEWNAFFDEVFFN